MLLTPPETFANGSSCLMRRVASMKLSRVAIVLLNAGADGEDVRIENNVAALEADFLRQQFISPVANGQFVIDFGGLAGFVEGHYNDGGAIAPGQVSRDEEMLLRPLLN